jgi:hypothetical protein
MQCPDVFVEHSLGVRENPAFTQSALKAEDIHAGKLRAGNLVNLAAGV